jgi:hypothetical protein
LLLTLALGASASAELRRVETVGSVSLPAGPGEPPPRESALRDGLAEAVRSIARDLLRDSPGSDPSAVGHALGPLPGTYVVRHRLVEDRGERAALLAADPGASREYVVVVEAEVDVDRVRERLAGAGLSPRPTPGSQVPASGAGASASGPPPSAPSASGPAAAPVALEALAVPPGELLLVLESPSGSVYTALRAGLRADSEVKGVLPVEFAAGRAALTVATALGPGDLLARLRGALPDLRIEEVRPPEGRVLVLRAEAAPPPTLEAAPGAPEGGPGGAGAPGAPAPETFDTPNPNRY